MLQVFFGGGYDLIEKAIEKSVSGFSRMHPGAVVYRYDPYNFEVTRFDELLHGVSLFSPQHVVVIADLLGFPETREVILARLESIETSPHLFLLREAGLEAKTLKVLKEKSSVTEIKASQTPKKIDAFPLGEEVVRGNRRKAWLMYQKFLAAGLDAEDIFFPVAWKVRSGALTERSLSRRVHLVGLSREFLILYHEARRGKKELAEGLERIILGLVPTP